MDPKQLDDLLAVLRKHGVASAEVPLPPASYNLGTLRVVFGPDTGPMPGVAPEPGGWKSPQNLDRDPLEGEASVP